MLVHLWNVSFARQVPFSALENVDNYVPSHRFWSFLTSAARSQGIESLGFHVGHKFGADCADPQLTRLLRRSPTLYQGLVKASELTNKTITHCRLGLIQPPGSRCVYFYHRPSCSAKNPAIDQIGWFGLMMLIGAVRVFAGPKWCPYRIGLMKNHTPYDCVLEQFPNTEFRIPANRGDQAEDLVPSVARSGRYRYNLPERFSTASGRQRVALFIAASVA